LFNFKKQQQEDKMEKQETSTFPLDSQALVPESCEYRNWAGLLARSSLRRLPDTNISDLGAANPFGTYSYGHSS